MRIQKIGVAIFQVMHQILLLLYFMSLIRATIITLLLISTSLQTNISKRNDLKCDAHDYCQVSKHQHNLIFVTNNGNIYKYNPISKLIIWEASLKMDLIKFNFTNVNQETNQYFLPGFDGNFIYVSAKKKMIEIDRGQLETMLNVCFDQQSKYFIYDSVLYYLLDIETGHLVQLEQYLKLKIPVGKTKAIVRLDRKYLKYLTKQLNQKWSIISTDVHILTIQQFLKQPKFKLEYSENQLYTFKRVSQNLIEIQDKQHNMFYEIQSQQDFVSIFSFSGKQFKKHWLPLKKFGLKEIKKQSTNSLAVYDQITYGLKLYEKGLPLTFFNNKVQDNKFIQYDLQIDQKQFCLNSYKVLKKVKGEQIKKLPQPKQKQEVNTKYVSYFSIGIIGGCILIIVSLLINFYYKKFTQTIRKQIQKDKSIFQQKMKEVEKKIEDSLKPQKIYQIHYDKLIKSHEEYKIYQATLLNKASLVYVIKNNPQNKIKINSISVANNHHLVKFLYQDENELELYIFIQKPKYTLQQKILKDSSIQSQWRKKDLKTLKKLKLSILKMVESLKNSKINISKINPMNILFYQQEETLKSSILELVLENKHWLNQHLKDSIFHQNCVIGCLFYYIYSGGNHPFEEKMIIEKLKKIEFSSQFQNLQEKDIFFKDLIERIIHKQPKLDIEHISNHPFFWQKRKTLHFVNQFSNYMETFLDDDKVRKFQQLAIDLNIIKYPWSKNIEQAFLNEIQKFRKYNYYSIRDLIRVIRNKTNHFHEIPKDIKNITGNTSEDLVMYFSEKFPKLYYFMYIYASKKKWKLQGF